MNKLRLLAGILAFGSLWGVTESYIGSALDNAGLPSGSIMTGFFAMSFLLLSRLYFKQAGMQLGMGVVAGSLKLFNPFVAGCHLCSGIAIMIEGAVFESIWYFISRDLKELKSINIQVSLGIISAYSMFIFGNIATQILTPVVQGYGFFLEDLIVFLPRILARGILPALIGAAIVPIIVLSLKMDIKLKDRLYYPTTLGISLICWFIVIGNWFFA
jgi:hypothetical protein